MVPAGISPPISHVRTPRRCLITGKIEAPFLCGTDKQQPDGPMTVRLLLCGGKHKCRPPRHLFCRPAGKLCPRAHLQPSTFYAAVLSANDRTQRSRAARGCGTDWPPALSLSPRGAPAPAASYTSARALRRGDLTGRFCPGAAPAAAFSRRIPCLASLSESLNETFVKSTSDRHRMKFVRIFGS